MLPHIRKRRGPTTVLSQAAAGVTIICVAVNTEVSQEPSSKPRPSPPRISARPKVVTRVLMVAMKAASWPRARPERERLLVVERAKRTLRDRRVGDLPRLLSKGDLLVVNDVSAGKVFGRAETEVTLLRPDGTLTPVPAGPKEVVAEAIWDAVAALLTAGEGRSTPA